MNLPQRVIAGIIIEDGKLLLVSGFGNDFYQVPGGEVDRKKDPEDALKDEMKEELDIEVKSAQYFHSYTSSDSANQIEIEFRYYLIEFDGAVTPYDEIDRVIWLSKEEIAQERVNISEDVRQLIPILESKGLM